MPIHTVLGPIQPDQLGPTSMHEHLFIDAQVWFEPPVAEDPLEDERVTLASRGFLQWNPLSSHDNLVIDDEDVIRGELERVSRAGGSGIVDMTVVGLGRQVARLPALAEATGLHVMIGCGFYVHESHPGWVESASVDDLAEGLIAELRDGVDGTGIRPALIGEIGTSSPITDRERKVLLAAGRAGAETGAAVNVHLDRRGPHALEAIEALTGEGMPAGRIICSHLDERLDWGYHQAVVEAGAIVEYDTFGQEYYFGGVDKNPTDAERLAFAARLIEAGHAGQLVLGCDVWVKTATVAYGGMGQEHLLKRIVPELGRAHGVEQGVLETLVVANPRRLLDRPA
jgi:phosphotriesterase-related protein